MRFLTFLALLYLTVPGSGLLAWDGIPFSTRVEFGSLVVFCLVVLSSALRRKAHELIQGVPWRSLIAPMLILLCVLKLLSFAWSPLSAGFGACYRSIWQPLADSAACEKSYEAPFIQGHGLPEARVSRVDSKVDFGVNQYDWNLPFMNEWTRFQALWLSRFPFSATYTATIENPDDEASYLPIRAIGDISIKVDGQVVAKTVNYDRHYLLAIPVRPGRSALEIVYRYQDVPGTVLPDVSTAPTPRGPYAQLKIGRLKSLPDLRRVTTVRITGDANQDWAPESLTSLAVRDRQGRVIARNRDGLMSDQTKYGELFQTFDLDIQFPLTALTANHGGLFLTIGDQPLALAQLVSLDESPFGVSVREVTSSALSLTTILTTDESSLEPIKAGPFREPSLLLRLLLIILDVASLVIVIFLICAIILAMRYDLLRASLMGGAVWLATGPLYQLLPRALGGDQELIIPYLIVIPLILSAYRITLRYPGPFLLPAGVALAAQKVFDYLRFNHPGEGDPWWGKLVYMWRDSDWYTNHGLARSIFTESFWRGGEDVYWARLGPRYLLFLAQFVLGENDILIGLVSMTIAFTMVFYLIARFMEMRTSRISKWVATASAFFLTVLLGDQVITAFGFLVTSEFTTWIGLLGIYAYLCRAELEYRIWPAVLAAASLAVLAHFRPNLVFTCITLLLMVVLIGPSRTNALAGKRALSVLVAFTALLPIALIHNLYYGARFVPFTKPEVLAVGNLSRFSWNGILGEPGLTETLRVIWSQLRFIMRWSAPTGDPSYVIGFWGAQMLLLAALVMRSKHRLILRPKTLIALTPFSYVIPMLSFSLTSYYPRHLVSASLLCLCCALLIWPTDEEALGAPNASQHRVRTT
ncbi:MAG: hypothetical protein EBT21_02920 [Actinobacteria bacterium]|nr:hypothetical protein [Actinomycetota bacterium]